MQAIELGCSYFPPEMGGKVWCWGDDNEIFTEGVNMYVKMTYVDAPANSSVTEDAPWILTNTGDACRVSSSGHLITICGAKESDKR
jgi:hypothetical protein